MSRLTYYIVQTAAVLFVHNGGDVFPHVEGYGSEKAAHLSLAEARRLYREYKARRDEHTPRRFPRIIRVTVETKTITNRR